MSANPLKTSFAEVVVVGGGIVGIATALALAGRGVSVVVCEKGRIGGEQSSRNWGWVRRTRRDLRELPLMRESARLWSRMDEIVGGDSGFRPAGLLWGAEDDKGAAAFEGWLNSARDYDVDARMITGEELDRHIPCATRQFKSAMYSVRDGWAEPEQATLAMAHAAKRQGAVIMTNTAVRGLDLQAGRLAAVVTEHGPIRCNAVVVAGGAWSRRFLSDLDLTLPQLKVRSSALRTGPVPGGPSAGFLCNDGAFRKRLDGGFTIANSYVSVVPIVPDSFRFFGDFLPNFLTDLKGLKLRLDSRFVREWQEHRRAPLDQVSPYELCRVLDPAPDIQFARAAMAKLSKRFSFLEGATVAAEWAGMIDVMPDVIPVISTVDAIPGLVVATGFSGHGFGIAPGAGVLAADLATGREPIVDPYDFRFSRFSDQPVSKSKEARSS